MFSLLSDAIYAVHTSSPLHYALRLGNTFSSARVSETYDMHTSQAFYTRVNDSVLIVVVKQEGDSHGS